MKKILAVALACLAFAGCGNQGDRKKLSLGAIYNFPTHVTAAMDSVMDDSPIVFVHVWGDGDKNFEKEKFEKFIFDNDLLKNANKEQTQGIGDYIQQIKTGPYNDSAYNLGQKDGKTYCSFMIERREYLDSSRELQVKDWGLEDIPDVAKKFDPTALGLFTIDHEIKHCLDFEKPIPHIRKDGEDGKGKYNEDESAADLFALLRQFQRTGDVPFIRFVEGLRTYTEGEGDYTHYTAPSIANLLKHIQAGDITQEKLKNMRPSELSDLATQLQTEVQADEADESIRAEKDPELSKKLVEQGKAEMKAALGI